jgi:hypothetical protein
MGRRHEQRDAAPAGWRRPMVFVLIGLGLIALGVVVLATG